MLEVKLAPSREEASGELASVLASTLFLRSPRLSRLLEYLCNRYLEGAAEVKEYQIGVEVLGRPTTFDPAEDAAARVEAYRLRKRLRDYYEGEGRSHQWRIEMPLGHYAIVFQRMSVEAPLETNGHAKLEDPETVSILPSEPGQALTETPPAAPVRKTRILWWGVVLLTVASLATFWSTRGSRQAPSRVSATAATIITPNHLPPEPTPLAPGSQTWIRIACGRAKNHIDRWGEVWAADHFYEGGRPFEIPRQFIARAYDPPLFRAGRTGNFTYKIPLNPGTYELHLYFMEGVYGPAMPAGGGEISRLFDVQINGKPLLTRFDMYADAGGSNIADVRAFKDISPDTDHNLTISFHSLTGMALINAIELVPARPHRLNPIRIVAQEGFYTDSSGAVWLPDRYYNGGQTATHSVDLQGTRDRDLFTRERYGRFDYAIPVDKGTYKLSLYFAEEYYVPGGAHGSNPGTRVFDVTCNGVSLLHNFDLLKEGGPNQAIVKTFHGLTPNGQGTLLVAFSPVRDYASLYAIEVTDESN